MKNEILYNKTVQILEDAYMNDTLMHGDCAACAVGNIIAANNSFKITGMGFWQSKNTNYISPCWTKVFASGRIKDELFKSFELESYEGHAALEIDSTGYSVYDLAEIEFAFETANIGENDDEWMFNGLCAVIDVLKEIHEVTEDIVKSSKLNLQNVYNRNLERCS